MASNKPSMADQEDSRAGRPSTGGFIAVKNLQLPHGVVAPNVWGKLKEQPVLATVNLHLSQGFTSAASKDALDQSTIHYGDLAKRIRASSVADQGILDLLSAVEGAVCAMSIREDGSSKIVTSETELTLPKASMLGEKVTMSKIQQYDATGKATSTRLLFMAEKMKVMALIGVNDYERKARQPVIATLRLSIDYEAVEAAKLAGVLVLEHKIANVGSIPGLHKRTLLTFRKRSYKTRLSRLLKRSPT